MRSSDWWAKEKECKDSDGKRERSSAKLGEPGAVISGPGGNIAFREAERARLVEGLLEDAAVEGSVGLREEGFWRMRRRPDCPRPWSCSVIREVDWLVG